MSLVSQVSYTPDALNIKWADGKASSLVAIWLRDHCQMPECRNQTNGQRLINVTDFPGNVSIDSAELVCENEIEIHFSPVHRSVFKIDWLYENAYDIRDAFDDRGANTKTLWDRASINHEDIIFCYSNYLSDRLYKIKALSAFCNYGFIVLSDVPARSGAVVDVIDSFGYVRETNYGKIFNVKTVVDPSNLAYTNIGLGLHADNPYRDPVPTIQLLHCIENSVEGGESLLADGFKAAQILRQESPESFDILTSTWINFRFEDKDSDLHSRVPLIEVNDNNEVIKVRFNNRSIAPIKVQPNKIQAFYTAYRHYAEILDRNELAFEFKLNGGDLILFDNSRMLHARKEFSTTGSRWLQGAYADLDGLYSTLSVLNANS